MTMTRVLPKTVLGVLSLLQLPANAQDERSLEAKPPAAASGDALSSLNLPRPALPNASLFVSFRENPTPQESVTLRNGFVIEQNEKTARYEFDQKGRISKISFPDGYTISGISYHDKSEVNDVVTRLAITSSGAIKTYQRTVAGSVIYSSWTVTSGIAGSGTSGQDFLGDFRITPFGEFIVAELGPAKTGSNLPKLRTPEGQSFRVSNVLTGAQLYFDESERLLALRRTDFSLIRLAHLGDQISQITEIERGGYKRVWSYDQNKKTWTCSDPNIAESSTSPFLSRGALLYTRQDGAKVNVSTTGAKTVNLPTGLQTVESYSGQVRFVNFGVNSRELIYDKQDRLVAYRDSRIGKSSTYKLSNPENIRYKADQFGAIYAQSDNTDAQSTATVRPLEILRGEIRKIVKLPQLLVHPHHNASATGSSLCRKGICPDSLQSSQEAGLLVNTEISAVGQNSLADSHIETWTSLDSIARHRGGQLAPLVEFLRIWAQNTSDEDIEDVTSLEVLSQLRSQDGVAWIRPELISSECAEYLVWLRERINENKLPCEVDLAPLTYSTATNPRVVGGKTVVSENALDGSLGILLNINSAILDRASLKADLDRIGVHGGLGVYSPKHFQHKSTIDVFIHELHHVWVRSSGREYENIEPGAHLGATLFFLSIPPEKGHLYSRVIDKYPR
jgi:hypothetical protein